MLTILSLVPIHHNTIDSFHPFCPPPNPFPSSLFSVISEFFCSFILFCFLRLHIWVASHGTCLSSSYLFHPAWYPQCPSMLLQRAGFPSLLRLNNIPSCIQGGQRRFMVVSMGTFIIHITTLNLLWSTPYVHIFFIHSSRLLPHLGYCK